MEMKEIIGLSETIDKAVDDYFTKMKKSTTVEKQKKYTLDDLKCELINYLINKLNKNIVLNEIDIDLIRILFDKKSEVETSLIKINPDLLFVKAQIHSDEKA